MMGVPWITIAYYLVLQLSILNVLRAQCNKVVWWASPFGIHTPPVADLDESSTEGVSFSNGLAYQVTLYEIHAPSLQYDFPLNVKFHSPKYSYQKREKSLHTATKKQTSFTGATDPNFPFWQIFKKFFQNLVKSAIFWPKSKNFSWKFLKISRKYFPKFFCKKCQIFFQNFCVFRVIFATRNKKINK